MSARRYNVAPSPVEAHLGFWLRFVSNHVSIRFQQLLEERGHGHRMGSPAYAVVPRYNHARRADPVPGSNQGATSKVMTRLEEKGLAGRQLVDGRAREQNLGLTAAERPWYRNWRRWPMPMMATSLVTCLPQSAWR